MALPEREEEGLAPDEGRRFARHAAASALAFGALYKLSGPLLARLVPGFSRLPAAQQTDLRTRVPSTVHAVVAAAGALRALFASPPDPSLDGRFRGRCARWSRLAPFCVGYFSSDALVVLAHAGQFGVAATCQNLMHHVIGAVGYSLCITNSLFPYYALHRLTSELSTPLVNAVFFMSAVPRWRQSALFKANAYALVIVFFVVRICSMPRYYGRVWAHRHELQSLPPGLRTLFTTWGAALDALNLFWLNKIVQGAARQ